MIDFLDWLIDLLGCLVDRVVKDEVERENRMIEEYVRDQLGENDDDKPQYEEMSSVLNFILDWIWIGLIEHKHI